MLISRVISALVLIPIVLALLYIGGLPLTLLALVAAAIGFHELWRLFRPVDISIWYVLGMLTTLGIIVTSHWGDTALVALLAGAILVSLSIGLFSKTTYEQTITNWTLSLGAALYIGWLLRYGLMLRALPDGLEWTLTALVGTWAADSGAYFTGRALGRRKLWPQISAKKTWEGVLGGFALCALTATLLGTMLLHLPAWQSLALGVLITTGAVFGDLAESLLKRAAATKDSGTLIPGHGGLMDRADSLLFVLPLAYYFAVIVAR